MEVKYRQSFLKDIKNLKDTSIGHIPSITILVK